jgi:glucan phosphoethanolaminetransferase (alkaline phosphatase superfamily)
VVELALRARRFVGQSTRRVLVANLPVTLILATALILPDFLMDAVSGARRAVYTPDIVFYFLLFGLCASFVAPLRLLAGFLIVLGAFEIVHFCYMAYFGGVIDANLIVQGIFEFEDVVLGGLGVLRYLYYVPLVVIVPYAAAWLLLRPLLGRCAIIPGAGLALLLLAATVPFKIVREGSAAHYYPVDTLPSAANSYLTASTFFFNHLPKFVLSDAGAEAGAYQPITVARTATPDKATVVIVMNESLTYDHLSLFGYDRDTTPLLAALASDPGFVYRKGIAAGVGTNSSFQSFWNGVRDPRNEAAFVEQRANLFRLAREAGFRTIVLSAQRANLLRGDGLQHVDLLRTLESERPRYARLHDEMFLELLESTPLEDRNLIVLHLRSAHGPYAANYARRPELAIFPTGGVKYGEFQVNAYDNAVRYNDFIMARLIRHFRTTIEGPLYVFLTSDHGQLLGEDGSRRFGHGMLLPEVARVPIMLFQQNGDPNVASRLRQLRNPTHNELTRLIDRVMGFEIVDPNAEKGVYYINGAGYNGLAGYIRVEKPADPSGQPRFLSVPAG